MIELQIMTKKLCNLLYREWENDASVYVDSTRCKEYIYNKDIVDAYYLSKQCPELKLFAIMLGTKVIGELQLKAIDLDKKDRVLSIHMQNNDVKNKGYGTKAIQKALDYAFDELGLRCVKADVLIKNIRSQHVLKKKWFYS